jgi:hypothetical protein
VLFPEPPSLVTTVVFSTLSAPGIRKHEYGTISQDDLDRFSWPEGQAQGVIDSLVEYLRPGVGPYFIGGGIR